MHKLRNLFIASLLTGLIAVELLTNRVLSGNPAQSQHKLTSQEQSAIMAILQNGLNSPSTDSGTESSTLNSGSFPSFVTPQNPGEVAGDALRSYGLISGASISPAQATQSYFLPGSTPNSTNPLLENILPPAGSELYFAYQDGGRFWYGKGNNILVIFPDEAIRSFNKQTGTPTSWLQDRLAYPAINDPDAFVNYQKNYRAIVVAETTNWVLMEFPSGDVLKVAKPRTTAPLAPSPSSPGTTIDGLPTILPGYES